MVIHFMGTVEIIVISRTVLAFLVILVKLSTESQVLNVNLTQLYTYHGFKKNPLIP